MFSLAASTNKAMATICLVAMLTATVQLQHGGMCLAQTDDSCRYSKDGDCDDNQSCSAGTDCTDCGNCGQIISCWDPGSRGSTLFLRSSNGDYSCQTAAALNNLSDVMALSCGLQAIGDCDQMAAALNNLDGVTGVVCGGTSLPKYYRDMEVPAGCDEVASALSGMIAAEYNILVEEKVALEIGEESAAFKPFYMAALPITAVATLGSGYYAYNYLGGSNDAWYKSFLFGLFVGFRFFDLMSDWGMWSISLKTYHKDGTLRHVNLAFSIVGSLLLILDLKTMRERADHWFGIEDDVESLKRVGYGMLLIVFLEDLPQLIITCGYFLDMPVGREFTDDPIAMTSLVLSGISLLTNAFAGFRSLC